MGGIGGTWTKEPLFETHTDYKMKISKLNKARERTDKNGETLLI